MTILELLETYPKAADKVKTWFTEKMIESFKDQSVPEEMKDFMRQQGIDNERLAKIVEGNPRSLFDVFDTNQLYIKIDMFVREDGSAKFTWSVNAGEGGTGFYPSRIEAEKDSVAKAFEMLNKKL